MRSSPAYADLRLDVPAVTAVDRISAGLVLAAAALVAWACARRGLAAPALLAGGSGVGLVAVQAFSWTRSKLRGPLVLRRCDDGSLQVQRTDGDTRPVRVGPGSRLLGPSLVLDIEFPAQGRIERCRRWLTPLDVPRETLRRWSVVLPRAGHVAAS